MFKSKLQQSVALSTAEAEYVALSSCVQEVLWLKAFLQEIEACFLNNIVMYEENQSAIAIAENDGYQSRAKHIHIWYVLSDSM